METLTTNEQQETGLNKERRTTPRVEQKLEFNHLLQFSDTSQNFFSGKILDKSRDGFKILVQNMILPAQQFIQIHKRTIDGKSVKLNTVVAWSRDVLVNGESFTEFGIRI